MLRACKWGCSNFLRQSVTVALRQVCACRPAVQRVGLVRLLLVALEDAIQVYTIYKLRRFHPPSSGRNLSCALWDNTEKKRSALQESNELEQSHAKLDFQNASLSQVRVACSRLPTKGLASIIFIISWPQNSRTRFPSSHPLRRARLEVVVPKNRMPSSSMIPHLSREFWP